MFTSNVIDITIIPLNHSIGQFVGRGVWLSLSLKFGTKAIKILAGQYLASILSENQRSRHGGAIWIPWEPHPKEYPALSSILF